jgi:hypothetical protein
MRDMDALVLDCEAARQRKQIGREEVSVPC